MGRNITLFNGLQTILHNNDEIIIGSLISSALTLFLALNQLYLLISLITGLGVSIVIAKFLPETKGTDIISSTI